MSSRIFGTDLFDEFSRLQRQMESLFDGFPSSIRSGRTDTFPQLNVGSTDDSVEIVAFAPGITPSELEVTIDKGLLTISGERRTSDASTGDEGSAYATERFAGTFRRIVELPENVDPEKVNASYKNGCLLISLGKRESSKPRSISIQ